MTREQHDDIAEPDGGAGGDGISTVARVTYLDMARGFLTGQDPKQFLFFTRTPGGIRSGKAFLARLKERSQNRDKEITVTALQAQLKALRLWGSKEPADLSKIQHPVLGARIPCTISTRWASQQIPCSSTVPGRECSA